MQQKSLVSGLLLLLAAAGCAKNAQTFPSVVPVQGKVFLDGQPVATGMVELYPTSQTGAECTGLLRDGVFKIRTFSNTGADGAVPGEYKVAVRTLDVAEIGDREKAKKQRKIPAKYASADNSGITVTIREGENSLAPIELKTGGS